MRLGEIGMPGRRYLYLIVASIITLFSLLAFHRSSYDLTQLRENVGSLDALASITKGKGWSTGSGSGSNSDSVSVSISDSDPNKPAGSKHGPYVEYWGGKHWHSWHNVKHAIIFGDSWSITGFDPDDPEQPRPENPMGNPEWPGATSTNGPCWVDHFTLVYNESLVLTCNMAAGGATVDMDLIAPGVDHSTLRSLKTQMVEQWPTLYGHHPKTYPWTADSSIFIIWIGLNDIHNADDEKQHMFPEVMAEFAQFVDILYQTGARNIMFMTIPPIERAPLAEIIDTTAEWHKWVGDWNRNVTELAWNLTRTYDDATVFLFDTFKLYDDVMNEPCLYEESCGFEVTTKFCPMYSFGTPNNTYKDPKCPYSVDKYFWMNDLHPTTRTHAMTARAVVNALKT